MRIIKSKKTYKIYKKYKKHRKKESKKFLRDANVISSMPQHEKFMAAFTATVMICTLLVPCILCNPAGGEGADEMGGATASMVGADPSGISFKILGNSEISLQLASSLKNSNARASFISSDELSAGAMEKRSALLVDGKWLRTKQMEAVARSIRPVILSGTPVVVIGEGHELIKHAVEGTGLAYLQVSGSKILNGIAYFPGHGATEIIQVQGSLEDESDIEYAAERIVEWTSQVYSKNPSSMDIYPSEETITESTPYWAWRVTLKWYSYDNYTPYGKLNVISEYYQLINDGSSNYNWYVGRLRLESVAGYSAYGSDWKTDEMTIRADVDADPWQPDNVLIDRDPTTTSGTTTAGVSVGVVMGESGAMVTASVSWSYSVSDVQVIDEGDFSQQLARWRHNVDPDKNVGKYTYIAEPGLCVRVPEGGGKIGAYSVWNDEYRIKWTKGWFIFWEHHEEYVWISGIVPPLL